jgi:hypothetical protein
MPAKPLDRSTLATLAEALKAALLVMETAAVAAAKPASAPELSRRRPRAGDARLEPAPEPARPGPALHTFASLREIYKIPRATAYTLIAQGKLKRVKIGRRALITDDSARALMNVRA